VGQPRRPRVRKTEGGRDGEEKRRAEGLAACGSAEQAASVQIALRLPEPDVAKARELATRKGIGYQTLLKMLVHEGFAAKTAGREGSVPPATRSRRREPETCVRIAGQPGSRPFYQRVVNVGAGISATGYFLHQFMRVGASRMARFRPTIIV